MRDAVYLVAPDLAIKIVSSFDTAEALNAEVMMFLQSGSRQVWVVYPSFYPMKSMCVYSLTPELDLYARVLTENDTLNGADVLPGITTPIQAIFRNSA